MTNLDSIKIKFSNDCLTNVSNSGDIVRKIDRETGNLSKDNIEFSKMAIRGLNNIVINNLSNETILQVSAKILKQNYIAGINKNSIAEVIENVNSYGLININSNKLLERAECLTIDVTDNLKFNSNDTKNLYSILSNMPLAMKYNIDFFNTNSNLGVVWKGTQKSLKDRVICYDKIKDLKRDKSLTSSGYENKVFNDFKDVQRFEQNLVSFKQMRDYYGSNKLENILLSESKANYLKFCKMTENRVDLRLFSEYIGMSFKDIRLLEGDKNLIALNGYDWKRFQNFTKTYCKNNYRAYLIKIRPTFNSIVAELKNKNNYFDKDINIVKEIKQQLLYTG
jgi:hypothetical protein